MPLEWEVKSTPTTFSPDTIDKLVTVQVFSKISDVEIDEHSLRKYVGKLEAYLKSDDYVWFKIVGLPEVVKTSTRFDYVEVYYHDGLRPKKRDIPKESDSDDLDEINAGVN